MNIQIKRKGLRFSIRLTVVGVFALATTLTAVIAIGLQYYFSRSMAIENALTKYQNHAESTRSYLNAIDTNAFHVTQLLAQYPQLMAQGAISPDVRELFADIMQNNRLFYAVYIGLENGDFYEVVNLNSSNTARRQLKATPQDRWIVIKVSGEGDERKRTFEYYSADMTLRVSHSESSDYDPTVRPWYTNATTDRVFKTDPYLFQHLQAPGQSYSMRLPDNSAVLAVDITLSSVASFLQTQSLNSGSEIYLFKPNGELISSNQSRPVLESVPYVPPVELTDKEALFLQTVGKLRVSNELDWPPIDYAVSAQPQGYSVDLMRMIAQMTGMQIEFVNGYPWPQLVTLFEQGELDILQPVFVNDFNREMGTASDSFLQLPFAIATRQGQSPITSIDQLNGKTIALPNSWSIITVLEQEYPDIQILSVAIGIEGHLTMPPLPHHRAYGSRTTAVQIRSSSCHQCGQPQAIKVFIRQRIV